MAVELSPDDALVVLELQEADIAHFFASSKGKSAKPTDEDEAFSLYRDELARLAQVYEDDKIARSIAAAVTTDAPVLEKLLEEERRAREDHRLAVRLAAEEGGPDVEEPLFHSPSNSGARASTSTAGPSSSTYEPFSPKQTATCVICMAWTTSS